MKPSLFNVGPFFIRTENPLSFPLTVARRMYFTPEKKPRYAGIGSPIQRIIVPPYLRHSVHSSFSLGSFLGVNRFQRNTPISCQDVFLTERFVFLLPARRNIRTLLHDPFIPALESIPLLLQRNACTAVNKRLRRHSSYFYTWGHLINPCIYSEHLQRGVCTFSSPRFFSSYNPPRSTTTTTASSPSFPKHYIAIALFMFSVTFASVPLYQMFCQSSGYGGATKVQESYKPPDTDLHLAKIILEIDFTSQANLPWKFTPSQKKLFIAPGETALAFYTAKNLKNTPVIGTAVYHVIPPEAGIYFNKIQCFCFEEQMLNPGEKVDMPVFFFIDKDIIDDPRFEDIRKITLCYVFFESSSDIPWQYERLYHAHPTEKIPPMVASPSSFPS
ncbi:putative cytochrome c oxidase assembly protein COX11 protein [Cardiosporidium cionae]|uniref:Cytochrome c oxidase assembly protein COX11 protein n=1 Tax=Cardiosporidium cionae TaxID=476202 RepID=A0ABQ7JCW6_9APIC|nr:putative cytochrome c oxidase assembly protein COX11 protein [Cardiosporidium cionae]|eukprot:KAF8821867.1 putative cytochrome c oxidase assembly protein COX11 protein [Cardiosporidium cionae]